MALSKLDKEGRFSNYPGVTIVSSIQETDMAYWEKVYQLLLSNSLISENFALLPYQSYHMTAVNLFTEAVVGSEHWKHFIFGKIKFFHSLRRALESDSFKPQITFEEVEICGALQIRVSLPQAQLVKIQKIAKEFSIEEKIPEFFHVTLAYQFKFLEQEKLEQIKVFLKQEFSSELEFSKLNFILNEPRLCSFEDMTAFIPWNGVGYPFKENRVHKTDNSFFSTIPNLKQLDKKKDSCLIS